MSISSFDNEFLEAFSSSQLRLYRYIVTLAANQLDAEDILQETNLVILRKQAEFKAGTNFLSWAAAIAYLEVLKFRASRKRTLAGLSEATLSLLATEAISSLSILEERNRALSDCMKKLVPTDIMLVTDHYFRGLSWETIAAALGRTSSSVRHSICRIRRELKRCIDMAVEMEESG